MGSNKDNLYISILLGKVYMFSLHLSQHKKVELSSLLFFFI